MSSLQNQQFIENIKEFPETFCSTYPEMKKNLNEVNVDISPEEFDTYKISETEEEIKQTSKNWIERCYELGLDRMAQDFEEFDIEKDILTADEVLEINKELNQDEVGEWIQWCLKDEVLKERYTPEELQEKFKGKRKSQKSRFLYLLTNKNKIKLNQFLNEL